VLALAGAAPLLLASWQPWLLGVTAAYGVVILALVVLDARTSVAARELGLTREHDPRLYLGAYNLIRLAVTNRSRRDVEVRVRDTPPVSFLSSAVILNGKALPASQLELSYTTRPMARGHYRFGVAVIRWLGPFGLLWRQRTVPLDEEVPVYPNLLEVQKYDLLARRGLLQEMGLRNARYIGRGTEFESLREYQPDDDYRRINWKATARRGKPVTTQYETERSQRLIIMLDAGRMMMTRIGDLTRLDTAVNSALLLCHVALKRGDRVGLLSFAESVQGFAPPRSGRAQFHRITEQLYDVRPQPIESDYRAAFTRLRMVLHGRALVVLFTDLNDPDVAGTIARYMIGLARYHLPLCTTLRDPAIDSAAQAAPESGRELYRKVVAGRLLEERSLVLDQLSRSGVLTVDAAADRLTPATINRYMELKDRALL
jgi:uncharacterized protein (DUF58 family)